MARELWTVERREAAAWVPSVHSVDGDFIRGLAGAVSPERFRLVRYVPEDDANLRAALASVKARLERLGEKLSLQRMPAELMREIVDIAKAAEVALE
jgi:Ser/Thr protein kinase RdoA (MazF antagonist)